MKNDLMARIAPDTVESVLTEPGCRPMDFTHRPMKGFVMVELSGVDMDEDLERWVQRCLDFNPFAKSGKKK